MNRITLVSFILIVSIIEILIFLEIIASILRPLFLFFIARWAWRWNIIKVVFCTLTVSIFLMLDRLCVNIIVKVVLCSSFVLIIGILKYVCVSKSIIIVFIIVKVKGCIFLYIYMLVVLCLLLIPIIIKLILALQGVVINVVRLMLIYQWIIIFSSLPVKYRPRWVIINFLLAFTSFDGCSASFISDDEFVAHFRVWGLQISYFFTVYWSYCCSCCRLFCFIDFHFI